MTNHSTRDVAIARQVAEEIRVEMARKKLKNRDLACELGVSEHTAGSRLNGSSHFSTLELAIAARWLGLTVAEVIARAESHIAALAAEGKRSA